MKSRSRVTRIVVGVVPMGVVSAAWVTVATALQGDPLAPRPPVTKVLRLVE